MSNNFCAKCYRKNKQGIHKNLVKGIKILLKKKKTRSENMVASNIGISQKNSREHYQKNTEEEKNKSMVASDIGICQKFTNKN